MLIERSQHLGAGHYQQKRNYSTENGWW
jgi:hypothetical protein